MTPQPIPVTEAKGLMPAPALRIASATGSVRTAVGCGLSYLLSEISSGVLSVDEDGRVWRHVEHDRQGLALAVIPPRRAESKDKRNGSLRVVVFNRDTHRVVSAPAARLVYEALIGHTPGHVRRKNSVTSDNRPENLVPVEPRPKRVHGVRPTARDRFSQRFRAEPCASPHAVGECWIWRGAIHPGGYGRFSIGGQTRAAHRASWEIHRGGIPSGMLVLHRCDVRACVNPDHLFLGSSLDNSADMSNKGRDRKALGHPSHAAVTADDVVAIRLWLKSGVCQSRLGEAFGVSGQTVGAIARQETWRKVLCGENGAFSWPYAAPVHGAEPTRERRLASPTQRALVLERDGLICGLCRLAINSEDLHIDHILPFARGGATALYNLQPAHRLCNLRKSKGVNA